MDPLHLAHLVLVTLWAGLALAESVLELSARDAGARRHAARLHYALDLGVELPLLLGVLATGGSLAARAWPLTPLLATKIAAGLAAVFANLACVVLVVLRKRRLEDESAVERLSRGVRLTGAGVPFFLAAFVLGVLFFRA